MKIARPACVQKIADALFGGEGQTDRALRRAIAASSEAFASGGAPSAEVPEGLRAYVEKVARHAYRITDADITALKDAGYSEDVIFEVTVSAALGAGLVRMDRALGALAGEG